jgi:hypothetical protein
MISVSLTHRLPLVPTDSKRNAESRVLGHVPGGANVGRGRRVAGTSRGVAADPPEAIETTRTKRSPRRGKTTGVGSASGGFSPFFPKFPRFGRIAMGNRSAVMTHSVIRDLIPHSAFLRNPQSKTDFPNIPRISHFGAKRAFAAVLSSFRIPHSEFRISPRSTAL